MKVINSNTTCLIILFLTFTYLQSELESSEITRRGPDRGCEFYIDVSSSMRWYFTSKDDGTPASIQKFFQIKFDQIINEFKLGPVYLSAFGDVVPKPELVQSNEGIGERFLFNFYQEQKRYFSGKGTDLVGVFENDEFGKHFMSIVITDNIHSVKGGNNMMLIKDALNALINKGLHIYLIGMKSKFKGIIDPLLTGQTTRIWYSGLRPVYIWIVSPSMIAGELVTGQIMNSLREYMQVEFENNENGLKKTEVERRVDSNLKYISLTNIKKMEINDDFIINNVSNSIDNYIITNMGDSIEVLLSRLIEDEATIDIKKPIYNDDLMRYWKVQLTIYPSVGWADIIEEEDFWSLRIKCKKIRNNSILSLNILAVKDESKFWWKKWSTEDDSTIENGGKTLGLNMILKNAIDNLYSSPYKLKTFDIEITR
ncbi:MAG: hypothetical protein GY797_04620 [Deltaproteobacteria bacterium]|nr:hypothetical protein [Deltaproteobacteria bacterium]